MTKTQWIKGFEEARINLEASLVIAQNSLDLVETQHLLEGQDPNIPNFRPDYMKAWREVDSITEELKRVNLQLATYRK